MFEYMLCGAILGSGITHVAFLFLFEKTSDRQCAIIQELRRERNKYKALYELNKVT